MIRRVNAKRTQLILSVIGTGLLCLAARPASSVRPGPSPRAKSSPAPEARPAAPDPVPGPPLVLAPAPPTPAEAGRLAAPSIPGLLKPPVYRRVIAEREIMSNASLDEVPGAPVVKGEDALRHYRFYTAMLVHSSLAEVRRILTDYQLYKQMISYVDRADYSAATRILHIEGGIWKFRLSSYIRFEERGEQWIHYTIIGGHFRGLTGDILFELAGERGVTVLMRGDSEGRQWPPAFVIERGAEIVFGFTAQRMRNYIESQKHLKPADQERPPGIKEPTQEGQKANDQQIPQPRNHL